MRDQAAAATRIDVLAVRALGLIALNDSLLRGPLAARSPTLCRALRDAEEAGHARPTGDGTSPPLKRTPTALMPGSVPLVSAPKRSTSFKAAGPGG
jgi:hypothetical protein